MYLCYIFIFQVRSISFLLLYRIKGKIHWDLFTLVLFFLEMLLNVSSCAQYTMRPSKWSCQSLEQGEVYCRAKQKEWLTRAQNFELLDGFQGEVFNGQNLRWRLQSVWLYSERLVWGNRVVFQESCSHPQDTSLYLGGSLRSCRRTQRFIMSIPSGGTRTLPHCSGAGFPVRVRVYKVWEKK